MVKRIKNVVTIVMITIGILLFQEAEAFAGEVSYDEFAAYETKLGQLNEEMGTDYQLQPTDGFSYDEMVAYFTDMTMEEFEAYIRNAYQQEKNLDEKMRKPLQEIADGSINLRSTLGTQRYYYDGNNSLYLKAYTTTVSGSTIYTGDVSATGSTINSYPAYKSNSCTVEFSGDKKNASCTWTCLKYLSANVTSATKYTVKCTFTAGGGNVYMIV